MTIDVFVRAIAQNRINNIGYFSFFIFERCLSPFFKGASLFVKVVPATEVGFSR